MGNGKRKREVIQGVKRLVGKKRGKESLKFNGGSDLRRDIQNCLYEQQIPFHIVDYHEPH